MRVSDSNTAVLEECWHPRALAATAGDGPDRRSCARSWLILADATGVGEALAARLRANREQVTVARWGTTWRQHDAHFELRAGERGDMDRLLTAVTASGRIDDVVHLWSLETRSTETCGDRDPVSASLDPSKTLAVISALHLAQALVQAGSLARLWFTTRGTQLASTAHEPNAAPTENQQAVLAAAINDLALSFGRKHPELRCTTIDLDGASRAPAQVTSLTAELMADDPETRIAWRRGTRYAARLVAAQWSGEATREGLDRHVHVLPRIGVS